MTLKVTAIKMRAITAKEVTGCCAKTDIAAVVEQKQPVSIIETE